MKRSAKSSRPTGGNCFRVATDIMLDRVAAYPGMIPTSMRLVHAVYMGQGRLAGVWHSHAWVEYQNHVTGEKFVIDKSNGKDVHMLAAMYRAIGRVTVFVEYNKEQSLSMLREHKHYGPWSEEIEQACHLEPTESNQGTLFSTRSSTNPSSTGQES